MDSQNTKPNGKTSQKFTFDYVLELLKSPSRLLKLAGTGTLASTCVLGALLVPGVLTTLGVGGVGVVAISAVACPSLALAALPCFKVAYDAAQGNYTSDTAFTVSKKYKKVKTADGNHKTADIINQNLFDLKPFINGKKIPDNNFDKSMYFMTQLFNSFSQLETEDKKGNKILYGLNSHDSSIATLERMQKFGFIENLYIDKESARTKDFKGFEFFLGNLSFKDLINPKVSHEKNVYDASFNLTGKKITEEDMRIIFPMPRLVDKCYNVTHDKNQNIILKVDNKKTKALRKQQQQLKKNKVTEKVTNLDVVGRLTNKFKLIKDDITKLINKNIEKTNTKEDIASKIRELERLKENLIASKEIKEIEKTSRVM